MTDHNVAHVASETSAKKATKACRACASRIPAEAELCKECSTYQGGWRRWISASQATLALIVALISVTTVAVPAITFAISGNRSDVRASFSQFQGDWAVFILSNSGDRPGLVDSASIYADQEGGPTGIELVRNGTDRVQPGEIFRMEFMLHPTRHDLAFALFTSRSSDDCFIQVSLRQYDASLTKVESAVPCDRAFAGLASLKRTEILAMPPFE